MNVKHHPSDEHLLDYASGAMLEAWSLAIATHLTFCPVCRHRVAEMEELGGTLLDDETPSDACDISFDGLMQAIDARDADISPDPAVDESAGTLLPAPLRRYVGASAEHIKWRRIGPGTRQSIIPLSEGGATARLLCIAPGLPVPEHTHGGLEMTLVLSGAFEDHIGRFGPGDLEEADEGVTHQPVAAAGESCICLAVTDAPLRFKSLAARVVQPFVHI